MPNPRTPTALLALNGGLAKNPGRYLDRASEPSSNGPIGDPPSHLNKASKAIWTEVIDLVPPGVLQKSDRLIVELITRLIVDLRSGEYNIASIAQLRMALASLGMTPADRSRVSAPNAPPEDDPLKFLT
jgi:phage terminase small subunit